MDEREPEDALSDALLEREIAEALRVEPAREFVARVRCAIAAGPVPGGWQFPWTWAAVGLAALVIVTSGVVRRAGSDRPPVPEPPQAAAPAVVPTPPKVTAHGPVDRPRRAVAAAATHARAAPAPEPDVLIAMEEAAALKRLMQGISEPVLEVPAAEAAPGGIEALDPPPDIVVSPLSAILPIAIAPLELEGGEQQ